MWSDKSQNYYVYNVIIMSEIFNKTNFDLKDS